jgi:hypothetical protein
MTDYTINFTAAELGEITQAVGHRRWRVSRFF